MCYLIVWKSFVFRGYIAEEKYEIAKHFLLPKQLKKHGLAHNPIKLDKNALYCIINGWAREAEYEV